MGNEASSSEQKMERVARLALATLKALRAGE